MSILATRGMCQRAELRVSLCEIVPATKPTDRFLHQLPSNFDPSVLSHAMSRVELSADGSAHPHTPPPGAYGGGVDEFPDLLAARLGRANSGRFDPSRNRFANAVKRAAPGPIAMPTVQVTGARFSPVSHPAGRGYGEPEPAARPVPTGPPMPKASSRIKLRPPTLLPTLQTGSRANEQYLSTRATAIRLGHARNACLARAADAFRRGDGGAAKRFSREGKALNERMLAEAAEAAHTLVRERRLDAQKAVRERDTNWSDDPSDRSVRGRECGGGMGVLLGVAGKNSIGGTTLSAEERTECMIDLHTLHGAEGTDILSQFLQEVLDSFVIGDRADLRA